MAKAKKKTPMKAPTKQNSLVAIKGTEEYGEWMKRLASHVGLPLTNTIDLALRQLAEKMGFNEQAPKRQKTRE